jgi:hypothetical protein
MSDEPRDPKLTEAEDQWLDRMLDTAAPIEPSAALRRVVAEIPLRHPRGESAAERGFGLPAYVMSFGLLAALAVLSIGAWVGSQADVLFDVAVIDDGDAGQADDDAWEELALLAFADELDEELVP